MAEFGDIKSSINLNEIKSSYIVERIFSFLFEKKKLNIIAHNNKLKKMFLVDIENYKINSGKYKRGGKNGKVREYIINTKRLIFDGRYLNGRKNGKGKEYYSNGKILFDGEYLNGKKWNGKGYNSNRNIEFEIKDGKGIIKEYDLYSDKLKFEGKYLNGERNGKGKEYYWNGKLKFEGEYLNGKRNGKGKKYYFYGELKFEGEYLNGKKNGKGKEYYDVGALKFEGEYLNGKIWKGKGYNKYNGMEEFRFKMEMGLEKNFIIMVN